MPWLTPCRAPSRAQNQDGPNCLAWPLGLLWWCPDPTLSSLFPTSLLSRHSLYSDQTTILTLMGWWRMVVTRIFLPLSLAKAIPFSWNALWFVSHDQSTLSQVSSKAISPSNCSLISQITNKLFYLWNPIDFFLPPHLNLWACMQIICEINNMLYVYSI